jgi:alkylhydroperoxidase family enzyme
MDAETVAADATARVALVNKPSAYPGTPDAETKGALDALFKHMFPQSDDPEIAGHHAIFSVIAQNPKLALSLVKASDSVIRDIPMTLERADLREVCIQTLCHHFKCDFNFAAHLATAKKLGISVEQQALIPFWRTSNVFDDEQKLVIEYTYAVCSGDVPEGLFARVVDHFGEKAAIEVTVWVGWWSFWSMIANATGVQWDFGYGPAAA